MHFALMIEGQEDVTWADWQRLARTAERLRFQALFRSDHYLSVADDHERGALDAWATIAALAATTETIRLGTLVSPATFRHPSVLAKNVVTADHISGGRVELGIGTGWWEAEHTTYGFPYPPLKVRMDRLAEQLEIICGSWGPGPFSFTGEHWSVADLDALPKPVQTPHPPLVMGGAGGPRSAALAARFATEYNAVHVDPAAVAATRGRLDAACEAIGRDPATLGLSLMNGFVVGATAAEVRDRAARIAAWSGRAGSLDELRGTWIVGTPAEVVDRLGAYRDAGVRRVMLQHHLIDDDDALELLMGEVASTLASDEARANGW